MVPNAFDLSYKSLASPDNEILSMYQVFQTVNTSIIMKCREADHLCARLGAVHVHGKLLAYRDEGRS
jgi:hypothetical protein